MCSSYIYWIIKMHVNTCLEKSQTKNWGWDYTHNKTCQQENNGTQ
jgi:hypothetical protein